MVKWDNDYEDQYHMGSNNFYDLQLIGKSLVCSEVCTYVMYISDEHTLLSIIYIIYYIT